MLVVALVTQRATTGQAPIDVRMPAARRRPLSPVINGPFRALRQPGAVTPAAQLALCWGRGRRSLEAMRGNHAPLTMSDPRDGKHSS